MTSVPNQKGMDFALGQMEFALGDGTRSRQITLVRTFFLTYGIAFTLSKRVFGTNYLVFLLSKF